MILAALAIGIVFGLILGVALAAALCYIRIKRLNVTIDHAMKVQEAQERTLRAALMACHSCASDDSRLCGDQVEWVDRVVDQVVSGGRDDEVEAAIAAQALKLLED